MKTITLVTPETVKILNVDNINEIYLYENHKCVYFIMCNNDEQVFNILPWDGLDAEALRVKRKEYMKTLKRMMRQFGDVELTPDGLMHGTP